MENTITKEDVDNFRTERCEIENKPGLTDTQKNEIYNRLCEIGRDLEIKRKYGYSDLGIKDIDFLYSNPDDYYRPILAKHAFDDNYEFYTCRGDKNKELQINKYIDTVIPYLAELIDEKKDNNRKLQLDVRINLRHMQDPEKNYTFHTKSENIEILPGDDVNDIKQLTDSFYENYQEEMLKLRNGSSYEYDSVELLDIHFHTIDLRRGSSYIKSPDWIKK